MSALDTVLTAACWAVGLCLLLRFPGRTVGVVVSLALWPMVGPEATWLGLGVTVAGAVAWRRWGRDEQRGLFAHPALVVLVAAAAVAVTGDGRAQLVGVLVLVASGGWLAARWAAPVAAGLRSLRRVLGAVVGRGLRVLRPAVALVRCEHCSGDVVVVARPPATAAAGSSEVAATGTCSGCGARWVAVTDPAREGGLVWSPMPAGAQLMEGLG